MNKVINEVKILAASRDMTLTNIAEEIGKIIGKKYSLASLSQKLRNETITYKEMKLIYKILGYKIHLIDTTKKHYTP